MGKPRALSRFPRRLPGVLALFSLALTVAGAALGGASCHVFDDLDRCQKDGDCGRGAACTGDKVCDRTQPIRIGVSVPQSGSIKAVGDSATLTLRVAEGAVNQALPVLGRGIVLDIRDDESSEVVAPTLARAFLAEGHVAMVGPLRSQQALETQKLTGPARLLQLTPFAGASALATAQPEGDRYFFQTITSIRRGSAATMADYARERGCKRMSLLYTDDLTGQDYAASIVDGFSRGGRCALEPIAVPREEDQSYDGAVAKLIEQGPSCGAIIAPAGATCRILEAFAPRRAELPDGGEGFFFLGMSLQHTNDLLERCQRAETNLAVGFVGADVDAAPSGDAYEQFKRVYAAQTGGDPSVQPPSLAGNVFDAVALLALALQKAGKTDDPVLLRDALVAVAGRQDGDLTLGPAGLRDGLLRVRRGEDINYDGASGSLEFDAQGVVAERTILWRVGTDEASGKLELQTFAGREEGLADTVYAGEPTADCR